MDAFYADAGKTSLRVDRNVYTGEYTVCINKQMVS